jgi:hypothetical protein
LTRRTAAIAGVVAFVIVDGLLVALALRGTGSGSPADSTTLVTITQTVWDTTDPVGGA